MQETNTETGALALVGSGEYLDVMLETDLFLINTLGGPSVTQVACIPTASGLEPGMPERWSKLGVAHFTKLGAEAEAVWLVEKEDAFKPEILQILENSNFFYFSGGNPVYLLETVLPPYTFTTNPRKRE
jgi:peptidase E